MHFFSVFPDAWLAGTAELTTEESGAYWNLCCHYIAKDGRVPDDDRVLARIVKLSLRRWRAIKATLIDGNYIEIRDEFIWQGRCEERLEKDGKFATSQREKARKRWTAGQAKSLNNHNSAPAPANPAADASTASAYSVPNGTGGNPPQSDPVKTLWDFGVSVLTAAGMSEKDARAIVGKWRRDLRDDAKLMSLLITAKNKHALDPVSYIQKAISNGDRPRAGMC
jgi:uncharacterized protein YdaU (DUF1376 family)